jgi:hypothetical protein
MHQLLQSLWDAVVQAKEHGLTLQQAKQEIRLDAYRDYLRYDVYLPFDIESCWNAIKRTSSHEKE